ncbi:MAG TPA: hypothetical protein VF261_01060 [Candidatus Saccharimonadales bacterium]
MAAVFILISVAAMVAGGCVMAFSARTPSWEKAWASAYLVLIAGLALLGFVSAWHALAQPGFGLALAAFVLYNLGNACVLLGTICKASLKTHSLVVNAGGAALAAAMILLLLAIRHTPASWTLTGCITLVIVILVSMPIGLFMSSRRRPGPAKAVKP